MINVWSSCYQILIQLVYVNDAIMTSKLRSLFQLDKLAKIVLNCLELIHDDICGPI